MVTGMFFNPVIDIPDCQKELYAYEFSKVPQLKVSLCRWATIRRILIHFLKDVEFINILTQCF